MDKKIVYMAGLGIIIIAIVIAVILSTTSIRNDTDIKQTDVRNISISIINPPTLSSIGEMVEISYTLETSPFGDDELALNRVEILNTDTNEKITTLEDESLSQAYTPADDTKKPTIDIRLQINEESVPESIIHRLYFVSEGRAILPFSVTSDEIKL